eukprot:UN24264
MQMLLAKYRKHGDQMFECSFSYNKTNRKAEMLDEQGKVMYEATYDSAKFTLSRSGRYRISETNCNQIKQNSPNKKQPK